MNHLKTENLFYYSQSQSATPQLLLRDINLKIQTGETTAFFQLQGTSAGLLMQVLTGRYICKQGRIQLHGNELHGPDPGIRLITPNLFIPEDPEMSVVRYLGNKMKRTVSHWPTPFRKTPESQLRATIHELYPEQVNFPDRKLKELSPEEAILLDTFPILAEKPGFLLTDTNCIPDLMRGSYLKLLQSLTSRNQITLLFTTTSPQEAFHLAQQIFVFDHISVMCKLDNTEQSPEILKELFLLQDKNLYEPADFPETRELINQQYI